MPFPYLPPRFTPAEITADAWRAAGTTADNTAFYLCQDAARVARADADRYASIDGLASAHASLARHSAEYLAAVRNASHWTAQMVEQGIPFANGPDGFAKLAKAPSVSFPELHAALAALDAANEAGQPAPTHVLLIVSRMAGGR